jgi:hypothetical protein
MKWRGAIGDLSPRIDIMAYGVIACAEITVVVQQHHEAGFREGAREWLDPLLLHARVAVRHRNDWSGAIGASRNKQPTP